MAFTAQQARDNKENSVNDTLDKIYEKIKIVSKKDYDLTIKFGEDPGFEYCDASHNEKEIAENLQKAGYVVHWGQTYYPSRCYDLYINWRFPT